MNRVIRFSISACRVLFALGFVLICPGLAATAQTVNNPSPPKNSPPLAQFEDIASKAGLTMTNIFGGVNTKTYIIETTGAGVAVFDYDNDGWPDVFFVNGTTLELAGSAKGPSGHLYRNNHDGTFTDVTLKAGLAAARGWGQGVCVGDYDNDGWEDLYITYYGKNRLYHNRNGVFEEVAEKAGVAGSGRSWGTGCAFIDYDRGGYLDLVVANYVDFDQATVAKPGERSTCVWKGVPVMCGPRGLRGAKNTLYRNRSDGTFEDVTVKAHIDRTEGHYGLGVTTLDFDDDGWPDIYIACDSAPSILYRNNHDGTFTDVAVSAGVAFNEDGREQAGMGITVADFNGDGRLDLLKTNFSDDTPTLYRNDGGGVFTDVTYAAGLGVHTQYLGWGTMFFDFDNDGWSDLILANGHVYPEVEQFHLGGEFKEPRILYHNNGNGTFTDVSARAGPGITAASSARGLAVGDLWNDGRVSVVINNMNDQPSLLVNSVRSPNHWIAFKTLGIRSNRDGIGAKITVIIGKRKMIDEVRSGSSYASQSDIRVHFGVGSATKVDSVEVRWPSGLVESYDDLSLDTIDPLKEGSGTATKPEGGKSLTTTH
jgi:enediyne biosynthesis protein E4